MDLRMEFYASLWEEFSDQPEASFLFRFLEKKRRETGKAFVQTPLEELLELLDSRNQKLQPQLNIREMTWLRALGARAGGTGLEGPSGARGIPYKQALEALKRHPEAVTGTELDKLRRIVEKAAVLRDAWAFLYDAGFSKQGKPRSPARKEVRRRKDNVLDILNAWCQETHLTLRREGASGGSGLTDGERAAWDQMYRALQRLEKPTKAILPVQVDPRTGLGLYLVGTGWFGGKGRQTLRDPLNGNRSVKCIYVCLGFSGISPVEQGEYQDLEAQIAFGFQAELTPLWPDEDGGEKPYCFTLRDGEQMFSYLQKKQWDYQAFREQNDAAPQDTPEPLRRFFRTSVRRKAAAWQALVEEGRQASEQERIIVLP